MADTAVFKRVVVVGTHHAYQYGAGSRYRFKCSEQDEDAFRAFVRMLAIRHAAHALAEELNEEGLYEHGITQSVLQQEASLLQLRHCFCEPCQAERTALGVLREDELRADAWQFDWSDEEVQRRWRDMFRKREAVWCERLFRLDAWPVLFVCGADHADTFPATLRGRGVQVEVAERCWEPSRDGNRVEHASPSAWD